MWTTRAEPIPRGDRLLLIGGVAVLLAGITESLGANWDVQWHIVVGPDTFFTAPHLMLYIGIAAGGIAALLVVLGNTFAGAGRAGPERTGAAGRTVTVFGTFAAPVGFLVVGLGAAGQLVYGLTDLWWHQVYGFDATLSSPPHVAMSLCSMTSAIGSIVVFAGLRRYRLGRIGLVVATANVLTGTPTLALALMPFLGSAGFVLATVAAGVLGPNLVAAVLRAPGWAALTGLGYSVLLVAVSVFAPWATASYAAAVGLPMREFADNSLVQVVLIATWGVLGVALLLELGLWAGRSRDLSPRRVVPALGALLAVGLALSYGLQLTGSWFGAVITVAAAPAGALAGWLGWRWGAGLRGLDAAAAAGTPAAARELASQEA
ncbi:MAG TPA: hypothetical protein VHH34_16135 [Pseudonocardiaceae bacterium]|nr:hypothetical protein [Pseudonocardiaceae bacterium]